MKNGTVRMADVAAAAGVSLTTASLILHKKNQRYSQETIRRVLHSAERLGWRPNALIRGFQSGKSRTIGVLVPPYDSYWSLVLAGIHRELAAQDYVPITLWMSQDENQYFHTAGTDDGLQQIHRLIDRRVEGFILWPIAAHTYGDHVRELVRRNLPVVTIDSAIEDVHADVVRTNESLGGKLVADHLVGLGHRRFACLSASEKSFEVWAVSRRQGFEHALKKYPGVKMKFWRAEDNMDSILAACRDILADPLKPTAVFCVTDHKALLMYRALNEAGLSVPGDVSVVGFADIDFAARMTPPLTTVSQKPVEIGKAAARLLLERVDGQVKRAACQVSIDCELVVRASTRRLRGGGEDD